LRQLTFFHTEYGMPSGSGAEGVADLLRACLTWSSVREGAEGSLDRRALGGRWFFSGKKWSRRALLIDTWSVGPGREGNQGVFLGATNCLAAHMLWGVALARRSALYDVLALLMALK